MKLKCKGVYPGILFLVYNFLWWEQFARDIKIGSFVMKIEPNRR